MGASMGMDISVMDLINIDMFASRVIGLISYRQELAEYLKNKMKIVAPNLGTLIGDNVAARLISHAGSLTNLAKCPASTVQILGAEKALFRALKTRGNTPKYGLIFHSTFIGRAGAKNKGRISRYLANKCSIASRIDNFSDIPTSVIGEHLKQQVEDRLKFYETGENPAKNIAEMNESMETADEPSINESMEEPKKKKKKKKDKENDESQVVEISTEPQNDAETPAKKKKKKKKSTEDDADETMDISQEEAVSEKKKKKKKKDVDESANETLNTTADDETPE